MDDDREELQDRGIKRGDFIAFQLNSDDEVVVDDVIEVVNNKAINLKNNVQLVDKSEWKNASIEKLTVARVDDVKGNTITYEAGKGDTRKLLTKSSTAFIDVYDDFEAEDGVEKGDYIVLLDSSEIDGDRYDYVLIVGSVDWVEKEGVDEKAVEDFLKQSFGDDNGGGNDDWDAVPSSVDGKKFPIGPVNTYFVTVNLNKDIKESDIESAVLVVKGENKTVEGTVKDGAISFEFSGTFDATSATITVTNKEGQKDTATVTFKK
ncbi:hypothetical protein ACRS4M_10585 [Streptococcus pneumoniae]